MEHLNCMLGKNNELGVGTNKESTQREKTNENREKEEGD